MDLENSDPIARIWAKTKSLTEGRLFLLGGKWIARRTDDDNFKPEWSLLACAGEAPLGFLTAGTGHPGGFMEQIAVQARTWISACGRDDAADAGGW